MGPTWVLSAPDGPHVGPTNFASGKRTCHHEQYNGFRQCQGGSHAVIS